MNVCPNCHRIIESGYGNDGNGHYFCSWVCASQYEERIIAQRENKRRQEEQAQYAYEQAEWQRQQAESQREQAAATARMEAQVRDEKDVSGLITFFEFYKTHPITTNEYPEVREAYKRAVGFINGNYDYTIKS